MKQASLSSMFGAKPREIDKKKTSSLASSNEKLNEESQDNTTKSPSKTPVKEARMQPLQDESTKAPNDKKRIASEMKKGGESDSEDDGVVKRKRTKRAVVDSDDEEVDPASLFDAMGADEEDTETRKP